MAAATDTAHGLLARADEAAEAAQAIDWKDEPVGAIVSALDAIRLTIAAGVAPHEEARERFDTWATVDLMGHQTVYGHLREVLIGGRTFFEITIPETLAGKEIAERRGFKPFLVPATTTIYSTGAVYSITPTDEQDVIRQVESARGYQYPPDYAGTPDEPF